MQQVPFVYPAEDFGIPAWSPDGSELLISQMFRFDSRGECCLPFRPAIVNPDRSDFTLLTIPNGQFDMGCNTWNGDGTRLLCNVDFENFGGDAQGASASAPPTAVTWCGSRRTPPAPKTVRPTSHRTARASSSSVIAQGNRERTTA